EATSTSSSATTSIELVLDVLGTLAQRWFSPDCWSAHEPPGRDEHQLVRAGSGNPANELVLDVPGKRARGVKSRLAGCREPAREGRAPARPRWFRPRGA